MSLRARLVEAGVHVKRRLTGVYDAVLTRRARATKDQIWAALDSGRHLWRPGEMHLGTVNFCNAKCVFCGQHTFKRPSGTMSMEVFKKLADEGYAMGMRTMDFTPTLGDPLLDKHIMERARYARKIGFTRLHMTTNGILFDQYPTIPAVDFCAEVPKCFDRVNVSIGGMDRESYKQAYHVDKFDQVHFGISRMLLENRKCFPKCHIHLFLRSGSRPRDILDSLALKLLRGLGEFTYEFTNLYDNWGGSVKPEALVGDMAMRAPKEKAGVPCLALYQFFVEYDGNVRLCGCRFLDKEQDGLVVGNVAREPLSEILSAPRIRPHLEKFKDGGTLAEVCVDCTLYRPMTTGYIKKACSGCAA